MLPVSLVHRPLPGDSSHMVYTEKKGGGGIVAGDFVQYEGITSSGK